jgi:hypothetical protein
MAANYPHIGDLENRLGRHYSRFSTSEPTAPLAAQSLARRKSRYGGSNRRSRASSSIRRARWGASRSTCCCPSPSSSARSPGNASATRSPRRKRGACGWAATHRSAITRAGARSLSTLPRPSPPPLHAISSARLRAPGQGRSGPPRAHNNAQHHNKWRRARRQAVLARTHPQAALEPDLHRSDCTQGSALPRPASGAHRT